MDSLEPSERDRNQLAESGSINLISQTVPGVYILMGYDEKSSKSRSLGTETAKRQLFFRRGGFVKIDVHYYALLRERTRIDSETVFTDSTDPLGLWYELERKHGFGLDPVHFSVAVNDEFSEWNHPLSEGDIVVFLPPVSGG